MGLSFANDIKNAGSGVLSKNTDIVLASISFVVDILALFIKIPFVDALVSSVGSVVPKVIAMRLGGFIIC